MLSLWNVFGGLMSTARGGSSTEAEEKATSSQLLRLPPEIILLVADMLPTPSAACLALSIRKVRSKRGR
jgi:hypothetical protein